MLNIIKTLQYILISIAWHPHSVSNVNVAIFQTKFLLFLKIKLEKNTVRIILSFQRINVSRLNVGTIPNVC